MAIKFILFFSTVVLFSWSIAACPNGMIHGTSDNFCYQPFTDPTSWISADYNCMQLGGHLASVDNTFLNSILNGAAQANMKAAGSFWLGSTTMFRAGQWLWSDGSNSTYTNWAPGQPVSNKGSYCSSQHLIDEKWYSEDCTLAKPYFCEIPQASTNHSNCLSTCPPLPNNQALNANNLTDARWFYVDFTGKCYLLLSSNISAYPSFDQARKFCQAYGADDLVVINSFEENSAIGGYLTSFGINTGWGTNNLAMIGL